MTPAEVDQLAADEKIIEAGIDAFFKVGIALSRPPARPAHLPSDPTPPYEDYVQQRWFMSKTRAYQLIESGFVADQMSRPKLWTFRRSRTKAKPAPWRRS